jgi:hypothetical protein
MQKIFIVWDVRITENDEGNFQRVNDFMGKTGFVVSVTEQQVSAGQTENSDGFRGRWLVVADDGKGEHQTL